ncbi:MAG: hypothetical protein IPN29_06860 [Saprospiraceae bacterium]|nr:hypothetical protein [Saprospiraceae bacterium]
MANSIPFGPRQLPWETQNPSWSGATGPLENPIPIYDAVPPEDVEGDFPHIDYKKFEIPPQGLTDAEYDDAMGDFRKFIETQHKRFTGYQTNEYLENNTELSWLLDIHTNNVGDPFTTGIFALNTKFIERAVLDYFAALWRNDWPHSKSNDAGAEDRYWGYVMSMGATEGNIYALYNGRQYLSGGMLVMDADHEAKSNAKLRRHKFALEKGYQKLHPLDHRENKNKYKPIAFFSEDTHYSVVKGVDMCNVTTFCEEGNTYYPHQCPITEDGVWPAEVPSHNMNHDDPVSGTIVVEALEKLVGFFLDKGYPVFIVLNQGSTWKGAYDDVPAVNEMLVRLGKLYPWLWEREVNYKVGDQTLTDKRRSFWVHIDGALGGSYLPFLRMAKTQGKIEDAKVPEFDFSIDAVMSVVCSLHKWIGAPWPSGIYMTRKKYQVNPPDTAGYIGSPDTTLGGSRNGFSPLLFWKYFARKSYQDNIDRALETERVAAEFETKLRELEVELQLRFPDEKVDLWIHRSKLSLAVLFRNVNKDITYKYTVDSERIVVPFEKEGVLYAEDRTYSHIYAMPSLGKFDLVKQLIDDIREACAVDWKNAFPTSWIDNGSEVQNPGNTHRVP